MGDHFVKATTVRNQRPVYQTRQSFANNKLSNDYPVQYLDGGPHHKSSYSKQAELYVPDEEKVSCLQ